MEEEEEILHQQEEAVQRLGLGLADPVEEADHRRHRRIQEAV